MLLLTLTLQVLLACVGGARAAAIDYPDYVDPNPSYSVAWEVKNDSTFDDKSHQEVLEDGTVEGRYAYVRPDGKRQIVNYRANDEIGFVISMELEEVMPPFGAGGRPAAAGAGRLLGSSSTSGSGGKSFGSSSISSSSSSITGFGRGPSLTSSANSIHRVTSSHKVGQPGGPTLASRNSPTPASQLPSRSQPSLSPASPVRRRPTAQPATLPPPTARPPQTGDLSIPVASRQPLNTPRSTRPPALTPPPTATTKPPPPPTPVHRRPQPVASVGGGPGVVGVGSEKLGVAHVSFSSPTHQYSYPLVVN